MNDLTELRRQVSAAATAKQPAEAPGQESCQTCGVRLRCPVQGCPHTPTREIWRHYASSRCIAGAWRCPVHQRAHPRGFQAYEQMMRGRPSGTRSAARV